MLANLSEEIRQCYEEAEECARQARAIGDEKLRADYFRLEESWLRLARSYEVRQRLTLFPNKAAKQRKDLIQSAGGCATDNHRMEWERISIAPFDRDLELAVLNYDGIHALVFPCRRILGGWTNAKTREKLTGLLPTHWREWQGT